MTLEKTRNGHKKKEEERATTKVTMEKNTIAELSPTQTQHITDPTTNDIGVIDFTGNRTQ